jgi:hypothetical protein
MWLSSLRRVTTSLLSRVRSVVNRFRRKVQCRVSGEETTGFKFEPNIGNRHNWPIFRTHNVSLTKSVPENHIGVHKTSVV